MKFEYPLPYSYNATYLWPLRLHFDPIDDQDVEIRYILTGSTTTRRSRLYADEIELSAAGETTL